jgi:outer membrane protein assembly factor BamB
MLEKKIMTIAVILLVTIFLPLITIPSSEAQTPILNRKTVAFIGATPNPVGVGQETLLHIGITDELQIASQGWEGLTVTVTKPDNTTETLGPFRTDSTGGTGTILIPTMIGTYTLQTHFPAQWGNWTLYGGANIMYEASDSFVLTLTVQEQPTPIWPGMPLPTEYWTRPVDAQLHEWHSIAGNWVTVPNNLHAFFNDDAPETAHILWSRQLSAGGLAGGLMGIDNAPHSYEDGDAYQGKFAASVIIGGVLYYNKYESRGQPYAQQDVVAVNLRTGEELWSQPLIGRTGTTTGRTVSAANRVIDGISDQFPNGIGRRLAFGQVFYWDSFNYHGVYGLLWTTTGNTWMAFDALTARWIYTITDVPSGTTVYGQNGELLRLQINQAQGWMALWNATKMVNPQNTGGMSDGSWDPHGNIYNASGTGAQVQAAWEWNVTIPVGLPGSVNQIFLGDRVIGSTTSTRGIEQMIARQNQPVVFWSISLAPGQIGQLLYNRTWQPPADTTVALTGASPEDGVFVVSAKETRSHYGFNIDTGERIWGPTESQNYLDIYSIIFAQRSGMIAYGKLYSQSMSGILYCYNVKTGELLWTYSADDPHNQVLWANDWSIRVAFIADEKVYMGMSEHSPVDPKPRGGPFACVDANTGEEIWRANGLFRQNDWGGRAIIGDSIMATMDSYDQRIYAVGKGPSAMTVTAPATSSDLGKSIVIRGTVIDNSPAQDYSFKARFPNGIPAIADEYMSEWMGYVYKQFPRPSDATGVQVTIDVIDANGNYRNIGTTVSDSSGMFSYTWSPDIEGTYTVIATFAGSKSYWPSHAQTTFVIEEATHSTPTEQPQLQLPPLEAYIIGATIAIIAAVILIGILLLKKKA